MSPKYPYYGHSPGLSLLRAKGVLRALFFSLSLCLVSLRNSLSLSLLQGGVYPSLNSSPGWASEIHVHPFTPTRPFLNPASTLGRTSPMGFCLGTFFHAFFKPLKTATRRPESSQKAAQTLSKTLPKPFQNSARLANPENQTKCNPSIRKPHF